jgi:hypothetical protein
LTVDERQRAAPVMRAVGEGGEARNLKMTTDVPGPEVLRTNLGSFKLWGFVTKPKCWSDKASNPILNADLIPNHFMGITSVITLFQL